MHLLTVFVENKPGQTAHITRILARAGINIRWITIASSGSFGVMKFLVDKLEPAHEALKGEGLMVAPLEVLAVEVPNEPGGLQTVAEALGTHQINLTNCSGFVANNRAVLIVEVQQVPKAQSILQQQGFQLLTQEELLKL